MTPATTDASKIMELMAWDATQNEQFAVGAGTPFVYRTFVITPSVAANLVKGFPSKEALETALIRTARRPLAERAYANYWANPGSSFDPQAYSVSRHAAKLGRSENAAQSSTPPWLAWSGQEQLLTVPVMLEGKSAILVTGDTDRNKTMCIPGGGYGSVRIDLPDNWDKLMEEKGMLPCVHSILLPVRKYRRLRLAVPHADADPSPTDGKLSDSLVRAQFYFTSNPRGFKQLLLPELVSAF